MASTPVVAARRRLPGFAVKNFLNFNKLWHTCRSVSNDISAGTTAMQRLFTIGFLVSSLLAGGPAMAPAFAILHGAGNGILTIAKGTLPLALFGPQGYGARQGWLMMPARVAQALAPLLFGLALDSWGANALWLSGGIGLAACAALLLLRAQPSAH